MIPTLPMMIGLAVVARPLVLVLLGEKWLPCVPYLKVLSLAGTLWPLHIINLNVVTAVGRSDLLLRLEVAKKVLIGLGLLATFRISVMAMVWAVLIVSVACVFLNSYYSKVLIEYGPATQFVDLAPYAGVSALTGALAWAAGLPFPHLPLLQLFTAVLVGLVTYPATCYILRLESYRSTLAAVIGMFSSFRRSEVDPKAPVCAS
jgi:O-antigen/teichoic acid export membrane protein